MPNAELDLPLPLPVRTNNKPCSRAARAIAASITSFFRCMRLRWRCARSESTMSLSRCGAAWIELLNNQRKYRMYNNGNDNIKYECFDIEWKVFDQSFTKFDQG